MSFSYVTLHIWTHLAEWGTNANDSFENELFKDVEIYQKKTNWRVTGSLKMESIVASFIDAGKLLKRTAPEYLNVIFPSVYTDFLGKFIGNLRITLLWMSVEGGGLSVSKDFWVESKATTFPLSTCLTRLNAVFSLAGGNR